MPLVNARTILEAARAGHYAIGAFNAQNLEYIQGILRAAEDLGAPVILQLSARAIHFAGLRPMASIVRAAAQEARVPVVLHLDHGDFEMNLRCLVAGFTSLMFDGSAMPFAGNVEETRRVVEAAHVMGIPVEGELGNGTGKHTDAADSPADYTDPDLARRFVTLTGADILAVSVGNNVPRGTGGVQLDLDRVRVLAEVTGVPLVLHHIHGIPEAQIRKAITYGVAKINVSTDLNVAFSHAVREASNRDPEGIDPRPVLGAGREAIAEVVRAKIRMFGCEGKGPELLEGALAAAATRR